MTDNATETAERERLQAYVRILKQLPREAAAELLAVVCTDPELSGRRAVITQAAAGVCLGHRLGRWQR